MGTRRGAVQLALLALIGVSVVITVQAVGNMLVLAMLVVPAATARLVTRRLRSTFVVSVLVGVAAALIGLYVSYYASVATGACVVLSTVALFVLAAAASRLTGRLRPSAPVTGAAARAHGG